MSEHELWEDIIDLQDRLHKVEKRLKVLEDEKREDAVLRQGADEKEVCLPSM